MEIYNTLTEYIKKYDNILIMTHKNPDLDGITSAIMLSQIINSFDKKSNILVKNTITNKSVNKMLQKLNENNINYNIVNNVTNESLLIILDVNKEAILENKKVLELFDDVIVIDHHIKSNNYIKSTISYVNANLSSIAEFMTNYAKYLNKKIDSILATSLLAAIEIDTNNYTFKTNSDTHKTSAYLFDCGADNIIKQDILKESKDEYLKRQELLKNTQMIKDKAICLFDNKIYKKEELALTSEELISFEGIEASFTIGKIEPKVIGISARSTGYINVEEIMTKLNGGGHFNEAATEIQNKSLSEVKQMLLEVIK